MFKKLLLFAWIGCMVVLVGCEGKQGEVGPKGDTGAAGPAGPAGPAGADGQDGTGTGSGGGAIILSSGAAETDSLGGYVTGLAELTPALDSALQSSAILVYIRSQNVYWPLPGLVGFGTGTNQQASEFTFVHGIQEGTFFVELFQRGWSEDVDDAPERQFQDVRVVIIPGTIVESGRLNAEILKSYEKTIAALGLTEDKVKLSKPLKFKLIKK